MTCITSKGRTLTAELGCAGAPRIEALCSLIVRRGISYQRVQEAACNGPWEASSPTLPQAAVSAAIARHEAWCEKRDSTLTRQITDLVTRLAEAGAPVSGVDLGGDPRGVCVKLIRTDGISNSWGGESRWCIPLEGS